MSIRVFRVGEQNALEIAQKVKKHNFREALREKQGKEPMKLPLWPKLIQAANLRMTAEGFNKTFWQKFSQRRVVNE